VKSAFKIIGLIGFFQASKVRKLTGRHCHCLPQPQGRIEKLFPNGFDWFLAASLAAGACLVTALKRLEH
jgi:hypothetical protein